MTKNYPDITRSITESIRKLRADIPDVMKGFGAMAQAATRAGVLDHKTKELIALSLGVAAHCDACIGFHVEAVLKAGATRLELEEALGMAVYMGGGPSLTYAAEAIQAWEQFSSIAEPSASAASVSA